jgi:DNA-binding CsgD family transcriptional regulator
MTTRGLAHLPVYNPTFRMRMHCKREGCEACRVQKQYGLTLGHLNVISLLLCGMSNRRIGQVLRCSEETVKRHTWMINEQIGSDDRVQIALWAIYQGLDWRSTRPKSQEQKLYELGREAAAKVYQHALGVVA